jgi:hypothetical protein
MATIPSFKEGQRISPGGGSQAIGTAEARLPGESLVDLSKSLGNVASAVDQYIYRKQQIDLALYEDEITNKAEAAGITTQREAKSGKSEDDKWAVAPDGSNIRSRLEENYSQLYTGIVGQESDPIKRATAKNIIDKRKNEYEEKLLVTEMALHNANAHMMIESNSAEGADLIQSAENPDEAYAVQMSRLGKSYKFLADTAKGRKEVSDQAKRMYGSALIRAHINKKNYVEAVVSLNKLSDTFSDKEVQGISKVVFDLETQQRKDSLEQVYSQIENTENLAKMSRNNDLINASNEILFAENKEAAQSIARKWSAKLKENIYEVYDNEGSDSLSKQAAAKAEIKYLSKIDNKQGTFTLVRNILADRDLTKEAKARLIDKFKESLTPEKSKDAYKQSVSRVAMKIRKVDYAKPAYEVNSGETPKKAAEVEARFREIIEESSNTIDADEARIRAIREIDPGKLQKIKTERDNKFLLRWSEEMSNKIKNKTIKIEELKKFNKYKEKLINDNTNSGDKEGIKLEKSFKGGQ